MTGAEHRSPHGFPALDRSAVPDITAVIVNWNTVDLLDACLESLRDHGAPGRTMDVIVVDNGSTDGSAQLVAEQWPDVHLIANATNEGYTRANNRAIEVSRGRYLLLINADAQLRPGCLEGMVQRLDGDPDAAIVGPRLVYGDGSWQRWTAGADPSLRSAATYFLFLDRLLYGQARRSLYLGADERHAFQPDWVSSACMLVRREALDEIGLMDETYFCYMDDVDLCRRARDAGWRVWYEPGAEAIHLMGQSTRRQTGAASPAALRNFNDYFERQHGRAAAAGLRALEVAGFGTRAAAYLAASLGGGERRDQARNHLRNLRVSLQWGRV